MRYTGLFFVSLFILPILLLSAAAATAEPLRVLLLDYHAPTEHDVLLSHLCVQRCTEANGCPEAYRLDGVDYFSDDFIVYRPGYLGQNASFIVDIYKDRRIDLLSFSGHHASGFSGERGRGRFDTEMLGRDMPEVDGAARFFTQPTLVMLQGCRTDVKSTFAGDPMEYVLHVIHDTQVRGTDFERLMAAVQQIGGVQEAYRDLFPNACILGYEGTQTPGGRLEIYGQIHAWMRGLAHVGKAADEIPPSKFDLAKAFKTRDGIKSTNREVERECRRGWPCDLCRADGATYTPLKNALAAWLKRQQKRVHLDARQLPAERRQALESSLEQTSFYANSSWSCDARPPGTEPIWPDPVDESPFGRLYIELLLRDFENFTADQQRELRAELVHRMGRIEFQEIDAIELRAWLHGPDQWGHFWDFVKQPLLHMSTFRQQDFFAFLSALECRDCFTKVFAELPSIQRENAALKLRPSLGAEVYRAALADVHPRVRQRAASRLDAAMAPDILQIATQHADAEVRRRAIEALSAAQTPAPSAGEAGSAESTTNAGGR